VQEVCDGYVNVHDSDGTKGIWVKKDKLMLASSQVEYLKKELGYVTYNRPPEAWLKTGSKLFNSVVGSRDMGIPYGKLITLAGKPSSGKTLLALRLMGKAQLDGAVVGGVDIENALDSLLAKRLGLDLGEPVLDEYGGVQGYEKVAVFYPMFGVFGKTGRQRAKEKKKGARKPSAEEQSITLEQRLQTAEELFELVKKWLVFQRKRNPRGKIAMWIDSTTAIQPEEELSAGLVDQNMRTRLSLANFLNQLTKDLVPLALNTNALIVLISQLRTNPTKVFSNPDYVPGGNGVLFYPSSINWMRRVKNIRSKGRVIGLESLIVNKKNKTGAGSIEGNECGIRMFFDSPDWEFVPAEEIKRREQDGSKGKN
jgi:RecA/RadA recombinase